LRLNPGTERKREREKERKREREKERKREREKERKREREKQILFYLMKKQDKTLCKEKKKIFTI
jgi:hypothetical protein